MSRLGYEFTDNVNPFGMRTHTLSGGTGTNIELFRTSTNNTAIVDGTFTLTFAPTVSTENITTFTLGVINFQDTWTGSWTRDNFTVADWQTIFTRTGMQFEGAQITAANFSTFFFVENPGAVGSTISVVPEPASVLLAAAAVSAAVLARRRKKRVAKGAGRPRGNSTPRRRFTFPETLLARRGTPSRSITQPGVSVMRRNRFGGSRTDAGNRADR